MSDYRKPPKPLHYHSAPKGFCRYCGEEIIKNGKRNNRANWHPACVKKYTLVHFPRETRKAVYRRDQGVCATCGHSSGRRGWELDHRQPLVEAQGRIEYWELPNLQTLCRPCHVAKTSAEATARADKRRAEKEARPDPKD